MPTPKFTAGTLVATPGANSTFSPEQMGASFQRHLSGDWGDTPKEDAKMNDRAVTSGDRIMSSYPFDGEKLWIITEGEAEHRVTTFLLPEEY